MALETINYKGTKEQWDAIKWKENDDCLKNAAVVYNYQ